MRNVNPAFAISFSGRLRPLEKSSIPRVAWRPTTRKNGLRRDSSPGRTIQVDHILFRRLERRVFAATACRSLFHVWPGSQRDPRDKFRALPRRSSNCAKRVQIRRFAQNHSGVPREAGPRQICPARREFSAAVAQLQQRRARVFRTRPVAGSDPESQGRLGFLQIEFGCSFGSRQSSK